MHIDIKNFFQDNFTNGIEAFRYFNNSNNFDSNKTFITVKEFYDTFEHFFPKKYHTDTILKYLNRYFGINTEGSNSTGSDKNQNKKDTISFEEFNTLHFDTFETNETYIKNSKSISRLKTNLNYSSNNNDSHYFSEIFKKKVGQNINNLPTPFDNEPLIKLKRIFASSKVDPDKILLVACLECGNNKCLVNKFQLRNVIKTLKLGITNLEIDKIVSQCNRFMIGDKINLRRFMNYISTQDSLMEEIKTNITPLITEIRNLIAKFYSNPLICFQLNDINRNGLIDFQIYKNLIFDMYKRNGEAPPPNFILIKNSFDYIDLRKDGVIDINEWCKALSSYTGLTDINTELEFKKNNFSYNYTEKEREKTSSNNNSSLNMMEMYKLIHKNRKLIKNRMHQCNYIYQTNGENFIKSENLLFLIKEIFPNSKLSIMQMKSLLNIAKCSSNDNLVNINDFFKIIEISTKGVTCQPKLNNSSHKKISLSIDDVNLIEQNNKISTNLHKRLRSNIDFNDNNKKINCRIVRNRGDTRVNVINFGSNGMMTPGERINRYKELKEMKEKKELKEMKDLINLNDDDKIIKGNLSLNRYNSNIINRIKDKSYLTPINQLGKSKFIFGNK